MSDQRQDDETLGQALGRAVESQGVPETPYERSRLARRIERPARSGWLGTLAAAAAIALFVTMGAFIVTRGPQGAAEPVANASATPTATSPAVVATAVPTGGPSVATPRPMLVYFARDGLPPVAATVSTSGGPANERPEGLIGARLSALFNARANEVPPGAINAAALGGSRGTSISVRLIDGDLATVEIGITDGWPARGAARSQALLQQLVYTITEQPGIRRAMIVDQGKATATIDQLVVDKPLSREDVFGYREVGSTDPVRGFGERGGPVRQALTRYTVDAVPGLAHFEIELAQPAGEPTRMYPDWDVSVARNDETLKPDGGKWRLTVQVYNATDAKPGFVAVDRTPLRAITTTTGKGIGAPLIYELALDDLRPWRTALAFDPVRIIVDIGGDPRTISGRNAVTFPAPGEIVGREFKVTGIASAFEANVQYRVRDAQGRIVVKGFTTATNCCEAGGLFSVAVKVPTEVPAGPITLEVFQASPRDGSDLAVIAVPLTLR